MTVDWALVVASTAGATTAAGPAVACHRRTAALGRSALERAGPAGCGGSPAPVVVGGAWGWLVGSVMACRAAAAISTAVG